MSLEVSFSGHENIRSLHQKTIEITKESHLTTSGDCIVGVNASHACSDIPESLKQKLRDPETKIKFTIKVNDQTFSLLGYGSSQLILSHTDDIVIRKSNFVCPRTIAVYCDKASDSVPRDMVKALQDPQTVGSLLIETLD